MVRPPRVAVIGAGIAGMSAAVALLDAGAIVRCFEKAKPGGAQSVGLARIFRVAHRSPALVHLAVRARDGWFAWERRYRRRLVGSEGMLVTGVELVELYEHAMSNADAPFRYLGAGEAQDLMPIARFSQSRVFFDPSAGSIRARRTIDLLCTDLADAIVPSEIREIALTGDGAVVRTFAEAWECDHVFIAAGVHTPHLAAQIGLDVPGELTQIMRFTYNARGPLPDRALPCWIDGGNVYGPGLSAYGGPIGSTGRYAVGPSRGAEGEFSADVPRDEVERQARLIAQEYVAAALPGLDPDPVDAVYCTYSTVDFPGGDGFRAYRSGAVLAVYGTNLFKFAPLLGELFAQAIMHDELPMELAEGYLAPTMPVE